MKGYIKCDFHFINCNDSHYDYDHYLENENITRYISIDSSNNIFRIGDNNLCYHYKYTTIISNKPVSLIANLIN